MKQLNPFNRFEPLSQEWIFIQAAKGDEILDRMKDGTAQPGIVSDIDDSSTANANSYAAQKFLPNKFAVRRRSGDPVGEITVGPDSITTTDIQVAYDADGERIELPAGDTVDFWVQAPITSTLNVTGTPVTPFSTGRFHIATPNLPVSGTEVRYVFIAHLPVIETIVLPPDHETSTTPSTDYRKPKATIDKITGTAYAHRHINGYRIYIALPGEVDLTGTFPRISSLDDDNDQNPNKPDPYTEFTNYDKAIYIGQYTVDDAGVITDVEPSDATSDTPRPIFGLRPLETVRIPAKTEVQDFTDPANPVDLLSYEHGQNRSVQDHMSSLGTGNISPRNPHAQSVTDLTQGQATPDNMEYQADSMGNGITDTSATDNSTLQTTALTCSIVNSSVDITTTVDPVIRKDTINTGQFTGLSQARIQAIQLIDGQALYINGIRIERVAPILDDIDGYSSPNLTGTAGFIPFSASGGNPLDDTGDYVIFVRATSSGSIPESSAIIPAGTGILGKAKLDAGEQWSDVLDANEFPIAQVYWDATNEQLQRTQYDTTATVIDLRSGGLITKPNISTEAYVDPRKGLMALSVFENVISNGGFTLPVGEGVADPDGEIPDSWETVDSIGNIAIEIITPTDDATLDDDELGPRALTGLQVDCTNPVGNTYTCKAQSYAPQLKPNTLYTASMWVKILNTGTNVLSVMGQFATKSGTSLTDGGTKQLMLDRNATDWQRIALTFTTNSSPQLAIVDPTSSSISCLELQFTNLNTGLTPAATSSFYLANVVVVEGDWTPGFVQPSVHAGEIFMWDKTTSCPPGSVRVTALDGRMAVGANGSLIVGDTSTVQQTSMGVTLGGSASISSDGSHTHYVKYSVTFDGGTSTSFAPLIYNINEILHYSGVHSHQLSNISITELPEYVVIFCRRL